MLTKKIWFLALTFIFLTASLSLGCGSPQEGPSENAEDQVEKKENGEIVVEDFTGREITLEETPQRLVSTMPSNTEILFALGLEDELLGVTDFCDYPPEAEEKNTIGDSYNINMEKIVELAPQLVFTGGGQEEISNNMANLDIPAAVINPTDFEGIKQSILLIGKITDAASEAENIVDEMERRAEAVKNAAEQIPPEERPGVLVLVDPETLYTTGEGTFIDQLIEMAGGTNIATEQGYFTISEEKILEENPEIIINTFPMKEHVMERRGWDGIDAVENENVYDIDGDLVSRPGPRIVDGLEKIFEIISGVR